MPPTDPTTGPVARLEAVDFLRGLVMVLMLLDHTRDFFHFGAQHGIDPLDLTRTTIPLFFTRWITHYCAPTFVLLAGVGAFLAGTRGRTRRALLWFLVTRGLWLVVLELTWVQWAGWDFAVNLHGHFVQVIWALGWSMIALAALVHLPVWAVTAFGVIMIVGHNAFDPIEPDALGVWSGAWRVLHAGGTFEIVPGHTLAVGYPLVPWVGVMAAGYGLGAVVVQPPAKRRRILWSLGAALTLGFFVLRLGNFYGDPRPWKPQAGGFLTFLSFLDCTKYPPSLCYLLMTLGPALLVLEWLDRRALASSILKPVVVFGRVPLFFYLLHLPLAHGLAVMVNLVRFGRADWLYGLNHGPVPGEAGFGLGMTLLAWLWMLFLLYPACAWFADLKRRRRDAWLSYF